MNAVAKDAIRERVKGFIAENFYVPDTARLADDASLVERGIVDSTGILEVISFIEQAFEIRVEDAEAIPQNLDSIQAIVGFVAGKVEARASAEAA